MTYDGTKMLLLSTRNSDEAQYSILEQAKCRKFLCASSMKKRVDALVRNWPSREFQKQSNGDKKEALVGVVTKVRVFEVPEQPDLLRNEPEPQVLYKRTVEEAKREPLVILHTSRFVFNPIHGRHKYSPPPLNLCCLRP